MRKHPSTSRSQAVRNIKFLLFAFAAWFFLNLGLVAASWGRSYFAPIHPVPQIAKLDLRADKNVVGRIVSIIATKPTPSKGDYIGHMWVAWPETPPQAPKGSKEAGYYAQDQLQAIRAMAYSLLAPWGWATGQVAVPGLMKVDDGWWRHLQLDVTVDEARYQAALAVDTKWRRETRYSLRPGLSGVVAPRTWACQDYVLEVAMALGLKADHRNWTQFPMGSYLDFAKENGIDVSLR
jgi:hypothetical protein